MYFFLRKQIFVIPIKIGTIQIPTNTYLKISAQFSQRVKPLLNTKPKKLKSKNVTSTHLPP